MKIYYFSGTGNSYVVARYMSAKLKAELISIPKVMGTDKIIIDDTCIGIVFPSYLATLVSPPLVVERFIKKIDNIDRFTFLRSAPVGVRMRQCASFLKET